MKNIIKLIFITIIFTVITLFTASCVKDNTEYWPKSLAYGETYALANFGYWKTAAGDKLTFHNSRSALIADLWVQEAGAQDGVYKEDYYLVSIVEGASFTIKNRNEEFTVLYSLTNDILNISDADGSHIATGDYSKFDP